MPKKESDKNIEAIWGAIKSLQMEIQKKTPEIQREASNASKMASEYRNRTEESRNKAQRYLEEIETNKKQYEATKERLVEVTKQLNSLHQKYSDNLNGLDREITTLQNKSSQVQSLVSELDSYFEGNRNISEKIKHLNELISSGEESTTQINQVLKNARSKKQEIDDLHIEILGKDIHDEETGEKDRIEGLKDELDGAYEEYSQKFEILTKDLEILQTSSADKYEKISNDWIKRYRSLEKEIQDLLPNALTAGLSSAYSKKKEDEEIDLEIHTRNFRWSIGFLVVASLIPFGVATYLLTQHTPLIDVIKDLPRMVLSILPLYVPLLWLAYSTNKKVKLSKRLIEEYTHKEVLSRTFEGLSKQIDSIENNSISYELKIKLLYNLLNVSSENPGKLISDYNNSDHPIMDALDKSSKLTNAVDKLEKIPGFSKISNLMEKRAKRIIDNEAQKVDDALESISNIDKGETGENDTIAQ